MPRIAVCHPRMRRGGSEARALWLLQALRGRADRTLVTLGEVDLRTLNAYYGTDLADDEFTIERPRGGPTLARLQDGAALRGALLERHLRGRHAAFDLIVSAYNPLAVPGLHFVADFSWAPELRTAFDGVSAAPARDAGPGRRAYGVLVDAVRGAPASEEERHATLIANSCFTRDVLRDRLALQCARVVYPPVASPHGGPPARERALTFVSLGRLSPEKRVEEQIEVLSAVRTLGHELRFRIFGGPLRGPYADRLRARVAAEDGWVTLDGWLSGASKWDVLRGSRFAIHGRHGEAFGIAVAEMARAGCIPFVPAVGAPAEIVDDERLTFVDHDDAVRKVHAVLADEQLQDTLSADLLDRGRRFDTDLFADAARALIHDAVDGAQAR